jgi:hypothetical protein
MALTGTDGGHQIVEPYGPVVVSEGQDGSTGTATTDASLNHGMNLDGAAGQNKDLTQLSKAGSSERLLYLTRTHLPFVYSDRTPLSVDHHQ